MSEATKRVWVTEMTFESGFGTSFDEPMRECIEYVRADIVEEMREALEFAKVWTNQRVFIQAVKPKIEAALKRLEEE